MKFICLLTELSLYILLDEFEKCERSVQRLFLSVFEEGIMRTNTNKEVDFSKSIIFATTDAGSPDTRHAIGFGPDNDKGRRTFPDLSDCFDMELVNRFTHRYVFNNISKDIYRQIIKGLSCYGDIRVEIGEARKRTEEAA